MVALENLYKSEKYTNLNTPLYPSAEAARLVGISSWRVRAWIKGYEFSYSIEKQSKVLHKKQKAIVRPDDEEKDSYVSFLDLIDLLFVKRFLDLDFSLQHIRKALDEARIFLETPHFASTRFFVSGKGIFVQKDKFINEAPKLVSLLTGGQFAFQELIEQFSEKIDFETVTGFGLAERWYPRGKDGHIVIDPEISFGQPTVVGYRVMTSNIYDLFLGEEKLIDKVNGYFGEIPIGYLASAVDFEASMHA